MGWRGRAGLSALVISLTARTRPLAGWSARGGADFSPDGQCCARAGQHGRVAGQDRERRARGQRGGGRGCAVQHGVGGGFGQPADDASCVDPDGARGSRGSSRRELDDPRACSPGQVQVPLAGVAVLIHVNPAEAGECQIRGRQACVCRDDVGLSGQGLDVCQPDLSLEPEGHRLAGAKVPGPAGTGADEQVATLAQVGDGHCVPAS